MPGAQAADGREDWKRGTGNVNANVDWLSGWQQSISPIWVDPRILDPRRLVQQDNPTWDSRMRGRNCGVGVAAMWRSTAPVADQLPSRTPNWRFPGFECNGGFDGASELRVGTFDGKGFFAQAVQAPKLGVRGWSGPTLLTPAVGAIVLGRIFGFPQITSLPSCG